jgi:hypothetical protein
LHHYDVFSESLTGLSYDVPLLEGLEDQTAGGIFFSNHISEGSIVLGGTTSEASPGDRLFTMEIYPKWVTPSQYWSLLDPNQGDDMILTFNSTGFEVGTVLEADLLVKSMNPFVGEYQVQITMTVKSEVGIGDQVRQSSIRIYPNPAKDQLIILGLSWDPESICQIFNIKGQLVEEFRPDKNGLKQRIDVSHWVGGIYSLVIRNNGKAVDVKRFIVQ